MSEEQNGGLSLNLKVEHEKTPLVLTVVVLILFMITGASLATHFIKPIRGNGDSMVYHKPDCSSYRAVVIGNHPEDKLFLSESGAVKAGFRKAKNC